MGRERGGEMACNANIDCHDGMLDVGGHGQPNTIKTIRHYFYILAGSKMM